MGREDRRSRASRSGQAERVAADPRDGRTPLVMTLFFVSGATGLLYEVLFSRLLHLFVGSTVHALTTVLTTFMGGLGLGAFLGGRRAARFPDPLRAYAVCELLIGVLAASVPLQLRLFDPLFALVHADPTRPLLLRTLGSFGLCAIVLLPPTALMGATLPILTEALARGTLRVGRAAGWLYAFNTFGAFAGALLAGFVLIPAAGQTATLLAGALTNATLFAIVWRLPSRAAPVPPVAGPATATPTVQMIVAGTALAASGFAAMVFQVGWTRVAAMSLGSSTYTFSLVVAAFIFGLAAGAAAMARWADALRAPLAVFAAIEIGIGASALGVMPAFGRFPTMAYELIGAHHGSFGGLLVVELGTLFLLVSLPTLLMGGLFPLAARLMHTGKGTGRAAGLAYSVNTIGSILGAFLAGFVLIPKLGNQGSLAAAAALEVAAGAFLLLFPWPPTPRRGAALAALVLLSVPVARALPRWDRAILISAPYLQNPDYHDLLKEVDAGRERGMREGASSHLLFYRDDPFVNVAVVSVGDGLNLKLNGKADASTFQDMATQRLVAYLPLLLHGAPEHVCVVGMGSGVTAGCASVFPGVKSVDILEIAQGVIDASRFFGGVNHLPRPNARVLMADGRLHLRYARSTYDVIVSEPSNPWVAGEASLFSVEYFAEARRRLDPRHGVMSAWLQTYRMSREAVRTVLRSFQASFPAMTVWTAAPGDLILVGAASDVRLDLDRAAARIGDPALLPDMQALGIGEPSDLVAHLALAPGDVSRVTSGGTERHTDDNGWLEWEAPRFVLASENVLLASEVAPPASVSALPFAISGGEEARRRLDAAMPGIATARALAFAAEDAQESGNVGEAERECRAALASYAREPLAAMVLADALSARARDLSRAGRTQEALPLLQEIGSLAPRYPGIASRLSEASLALGRGAEALPWTERLAAAQPDNPAVRYNHALALLGVGRAADAIAELEAAGRLAPDDDEIAVTLGRAHLAARDGKAAVAAFDRVLAARPGDAGALLGRASALWMAGDLDGAAAALVALRGSHPELPEIAMTLALVELDRKKPDDALAAIGPLLRASPDMPQARLVNAEALMLQGNVKSALSEYRWLAALEPPSAVALSGLALAAARAGLADEARATWERARGVDEVKAREYLRKIGGSEKDVAPPS